MGLGLAAIASPFVAGKATVILLGLVLLAAGLGQSAPDTAPETQVVAAAEMSTVKFGARRAQVHEVNRRVEAAAAAPT
jgi:hypothetical protein